MNVVVIPALEPSIDLVEYVKSLIYNGFKKIIVVNDGSSEQAQSTFEHLKLIDQCTVIEHEVNLGKGAAIKSAVSYLLAHEPDVTGLITADADGQHCVEDVLRMNEMLMRYPHELILGVRQFDEQTPWYSRMGNMISAKTMSWLYNIELTDTQTGLRAAGRDLFSWLQSIEGNRYEYELNMLIRYHLYGRRLHTIPIQTLYFDNNSGSHFHKVKDSLRIYTHMLRGMTLFVGSSCVSAVIDILVFALLLIAFRELSTVWQLSLAAIMARMCSSLCNFSFNHKIFSERQSKKKESLIKYYMLLIVQLALSIYSVNQLQQLLNSHTVLLKLIVDFILAMISYQVQLHWVFSSHKEGKQQMWFVWCRKICCLFIRKSARQIPHDLDEAVLVGHHQNLYGPIIAALYLPRTTHIWALHVFFNFKSCFKHYYEYTFSTRQNLPKLIAFMAALGSACVVPLIVRGSGAVAVYRDRQRLNLTFEKSLEILKRGEQLMIFPDVKYDDNDDKMKKCYTGFLRLAKLYDEIEHKELAFIPMAFHKGSSKISMGEKLTFSEANFSIEHKKQMMQQLIAEINNLNSV